MGQEQQVVLASWRDDTAEVVFLGRETGEGEDGTFVRVTAHVSVTLSSVDFKEVWEDERYRPSRIFIAIPVELDGLNDDAIPGNFVLTLSNEPVALLGEKT